MEKPSDREPGATEAAIPAPARPRPPGREPPQDPMIGREVDQYRIVGQLGGGGMGVVYKAEDGRLQRTVALKFLPPALTRDPVSKSRFLQEARAASALDHPNVCTVYDVGEIDEGQLYLAMPAYDGETVQQKIERGPLAVEEAVDIARQAAQGLAKAHRQGIVHRDIKPANLMVTGDGIVKILDFGLAKLAGAAGLTRTGLRVGTPAYMSPEQARGEVDHRTDLWSLGVVLYEMLAGQAPFQAESDPRVVHAVLNHEPAPLRRWRPDAPAGLERIVNGLLRKKLADRYPSAESVLADLRGISAGGGPPPTGQTPAELPRRRLPVPWVLSVLLVLAAAGWWLRSREEPPPALAAPVRLTREPGSERQPSLSPRGDVFVYVKQDGGDTDVFWERVGGDNPRNLTEEYPQDDSEPAISPDGARIVFRSEREGGGLFVMGATGESPRRLTHEGYSPSWSPDGSEIVYATQRADPGRTESSLWRVSAAGGQPALVTRADAVQPTWSPEGRRIAYWGIAADSGERAIWTVRKDGSDPVRLLGSARNTANPVWSNGHLYFIRDNGDSMSLWRVRVDEESGRAPGEPEPLWAPTESIAGLSLAGDRLVYATDDRSANVEWIAFDPARGETAGAPAPVTQGAWAVRSADLSPDGEWIAFDTAAPQEDLFVVRADGSRRHQLLDDVAKDRLPRWSPDGAALLFYSNRSGKYEAWRIRPDGSGLEQLTRLPVPVFNPLWSPDGRRLAFSRGFLGTAEIDLGQPIGQRVPRPLPLAGSGRTFSAASWSADGKWLAGYADIGGIFVYSLATRHLEKLADRGRHVAWLHGSPRLLYLDGESLFLLDTASRSSRRLLTPPPRSDFKWVSVSRDDRRLLLVRHEDEGDVWMMTPELQGPR
ncbi:MAG: protein kinase domain-containing protein [Thermoanaerobaculia bacterium]